jgi:hypothetical protein
MSSKRSSVLLSIVSGLAFGVSAAWATSFYARPFPDTVQDSPVIVRGHVGNSFSDWGKGSDGARRLYTFYDLDVGEVFKGSVPGATLSMRELGGEKGGIGMQIAGAAHFSRGEDVVVLLGARNADGTYDVHGLMMAKFNIEKDEAGNEYLNGPGLDSQGPVDEDSVGSSHSRKWSLRALRQLVAAQSGVPPSARPTVPSGGAQAQSPAPQLQPDSSAEGTTPPSQSQVEGEGGRSHALSILLLGIILGVGIWALRLFRKKNR